MIRARALSKRYLENERQVTVFEGLDLDCARGEYVALMGASGAGKTSLLQLLGCLDRPCDGQYTPDGSRFYATWLQESDEGSDIWFRRVMSPAFASNVASTTESLAISRK